MHRVSSKNSADQENLRQHFHNYFELLLGAERSKLQQAIVKFDALSDPHAILIEIDFRINYLRGAVRMGKLLCLIDQEEAKTNLGLLSSERESLRASALGERQDISQTQNAAANAARIEIIRKSL